jgi:hypothetical protein
MSEKISLIGKRFLGVHPHAGTGIVEAAVDGAHYLVRFDAEVATGPRDLNAGPERLAVVAISDMARAGGNGGDDETPPWWFFDTAEQLAKYISWMDELPPDDPKKPRVVPLRPA